MNSKDMYVKWLAHLFMINLACRFCFISSTLFIASTVRIEYDTWLFSSKISKYMWEINVYITCIVPQLPVIFNRQMSFLFELQRVILKERMFVWWVTVKQINDTEIVPYKQPTHHCQFLSWCLSECFGPSCLSWVTLLLEVLVAFWFAESEGLC